MGVKWFVCLFAVWSVCSFVGADDGPFLPCSSERITESCGARCIESTIQVTIFSYLDIFPLLSIVPLSFADSDGYSSSNVVCLDSNSADGYKLQGCPFAYYDSPLTAEVCKIPTDSNGTDLVLKPRDLGPGAYSFHCILSPADQLSISSDVLVGKCVHLE